MADAQWTRIPTPDIVLPVIRSWEQWGKVFTDVPTWTPAVHEIGRRAGLPVDTIEAGYPGTNAVFIVNAGSDSRTYVVKIYCPYCREDFTLERTLHPLLSQIPGFPAPALMGEGVLEGEMAWPYLILSFLPGQPIREVRADIPRSNLLAIARDLGHHVRALHGISRSDLSGLDSLLPDWETTAQQQLAHTVAQLSDKEILSPSLVAQIPDFVATIMEESPPSEPVLVSGDLTEDHVLLQCREGRWQISGIIDFADALIAPREYEWVALWFGALDRDPECLQAFMQGYGLDGALEPGFRRRALAFTFLHEFGALMIDSVLKRMGRPEVRTLEQLQDLLWAISV